MPDFGQLQGMAYQLGCELLQHFEAAIGAASMSSTKAVAVPGMYKCMTWGTMQECIEYLVRRVVENQPLARQEEISRAREGVEAEGRE